MPYELHVYLLKARLPTPAALRQRLQQTRVTIEKPFDLATTRGGLPVLLDGKPAVFEIRGSDITTRSRATYHHRAGTPAAFLEILATTDFALALTCSPGGREVEAARIVATAIGALAGGWFWDPQTAETIRFAARVR